MTRTLKRVVAGAAAVGALAGGAAIATAQTGDDDANEASERVRDPAAARQARDAALRAVRGGTVTEVEREDEGAGGYEVEVRRADGRFAEVALDRRFAVVSVEDDTD
jgi:uncharacterized membrane protein YkoI